MWLQGEDERVQPIVVHMEGAEAIEDDAGEVRKPGAFDKSKVPCKFWLRNGCRNGASCTWAHCMVDDLNGGHGMEGSPKNGQTDCDAQMTDGLGPVLPVDHEQEIFDSAEHDAGLECFGLEEDPQMQIARDDDILDDLLALDAEDGGSKSLVEQQQFEEEEEVFGSPPSDEEDLVPAGGQKVVACKFWMRNRCSKGSACPFFHGEQRPAPPTQDGPYKKTPCKFWRQGSCERGDACTFLHGDDTSAANDVQPPWHADSATSAAAMPVGISVSRAISLQRTRMCRFWQAGNCNKGPGECPFAHGAQDLSGSKPRISAPRVLYPAFRRRPTPTPCVATALSAPALPALTATAAAERAETKVLPEFGVRRAEYRKVATGDSDGIPPWHAEVESKPAFTAPVKPPAADARRTICKFWQLGRCDKARGQCNFAHGEHELGTVPGPARMDTRPLCKYFAAGRCRNGSECNFSHEVLPPGHKRIRTGP